MSTLGIDKYFTTQEAYLIVYFCENYKEYNGISLDIGKINLIDKIVNIAGLNKIGKNTAEAVVNRIKVQNRLKECFDIKRVKNFYPSRKNLHTVIVISPNKKGMDYFNKVLSDTFGDCINRTILTFDEFYSDILEDLHKSKSTYFNSINNSKDRFAAYISRSEIENFRNLVSFSENIIKNNIRADKEIAKIIDDNFMDLLA